MREWAHVRIPSALGTVTMPLRSWLATTRRKVGPIDPSTIRVATDGATLCSTPAALALAELSFELTPMQYRATKQRRRVALNPPQFVAHHLPQAPPILHAAVPSSCIYLYRKDADDFL